MSEAARICELIDELVQARAERDAALAEAKHWKTERDKWYDSWRSWSNERYELTRQRDAALSCAEKAEAGTP